jgi:5-methyltetrahydrofolate--homocysteine methyltransferase
MAEIVREYIDEGLVNIVGGCCGTTDEYIALFPPMTVGVKPRVPVAKPAELWLSGLSAG